MLILLKLGYNLNFYGNNVKIYNSTILYEFSFLANGFMVWDTFYYNNDNNVSFPLFVTPKSMDVDANT